MDVAKKLESFATKYAAQDKKPAFKVPPPADWLNNRYVGNPNVTADTNRPLKTSANTTRRVNTPYALRTKAILYYRHTSSYGALG